jgi:hypothetical protein
MLCENWRSSKCHFIVFGLTRLGLQPIIYLTRGDYAKHYITTVVQLAGNLGTILPVVREISCIKQVLKRVVLKSNGVGAEGLWCLTLNQIGNVKICSVYIKNYHLYFRSFYFHQSFFNFMSKYIANNYLGLRQTIVVLKSKAAVTIRRRCIF